MSHFATPERFASVGRSSRAAFGHAHLGTHLGARMIPALHEHFVHAYGTVNAQINTHTIAVLDYCMASLLFDA
jgi:hypothetical protein